MKGLPEQESALLPSLLKKTPEGITVDREGLRRLSLAGKRSMRAVMADLLRQDIWPERFSRCRGSLPASALARLLSTRVLVAGCGGLGGHVAELLARTGIGSLTLCDPDRFEESNLNRQHFCTEKTLGRLKAEVCRDAVLDMASHVDVTVHAEALDEQTLPGLLAGADIVMDCLDSLARKKMLEMAAMKAGIPCIHGAVAQNEGLILSDRSHRLPFSQIYPEEERGNREGASMHTHAVTVAGTACLMVSLLLRRLCHDKNDDGKLFHLDLSVPELETFCCSARD